MGCPNEVNAKVLLKLSTTEVSKILGIIMTTGRSKENRVAENSICRAYGKDDETVEHQWLAFANNRSRFLGNDCSRIKPNNGRNS